MRSIEVKVGLFVAVALAVAAGLIVKFGGAYRRAGDTYPIRVIFPNVGGLVRDAAVMYAGIPVGKVADIRLTEGKILEVRVTLAIHQGVVIREDAGFWIKESGLLGDRYIDVVPGTATAARLPPNAVVHGTTSVDLSEAIRSAVEVLRQAAGTIERVDVILQRIGATVLETQTLNHASSAIANLDAASSNAVSLVADLHAVIDENRGRVLTTLDQFAAAATGLSQTVQRVDGVVIANEDDLRTAVRNLAASTARIDDLLSRLEAGQGTLGKLIVDPALHDEVLHLIENWRRHGLLYKEKTAPREHLPTSPLNRPPRGMTPVPARPASPAPSHDPSP